MHASTIFALAAAALVSAAPTNQVRNACPSSSTTTTTTPTGSFGITNFSFGCTAGCSWSFDAIVQGSFTNHPAVGLRHCEGSWSLDGPAPSDYINCGAGTEGAADVISAFIDKETNALALKYRHSDTATGGVYTYYGNQTVYSATSDNADKQKTSFVVAETNATAVL